jgi:hypothetical protein
MQVAAGRRLAVTAEPVEPDVRRCLGVAVRGEFDRHTAGAGERRVVVCAIGARGIADVFASVGAAEVELADGERIYLGTVDRQRQQHVAGRIVQCRVRVAVNHRR